MTDKLIQSLQHQQRPSLPQDLVNLQKVIAVSFQALKSSIQTTLDQSSLLKMNKPPDNRQSEQARLSSQQSSQSKSLIQNFQSPRR